QAGDRHLRLRCGSAQEAGEARRIDPAMVGAGEQAPSRREEPQAERRDWAVVALGTEDAGLAAGAGGRIARRIEHDAIETLASAERRFEEVVGVAAHKPVRLAVGAQAREVLGGALE